MLSTRGFMVRRLPTLGCAALLGACEASPGSPHTADASVPLADGAQTADAADDAPSFDALASLDVIIGDANTETSNGRDDAGDESAVGDASPCTTRVTYGTTWLRPADHAADFDDVIGDIRWDGTCTDEGTNSFATLSNGSKVSFVGQGSCLMALDHRGCANFTALCSTRVAYGNNWLPPPNHSLFADDFAGKVTWNGACQNSGTQSLATLSNGVAANFSGNSACRMGFAYLECGGLYANAVIREGCPDPGVLRASGTYYVVCTSNMASDAFPIRTSTDLVQFTRAGFVFPSAAKPTWATGNFWAPEIHRVGNRYVAYFTARASDGKLAIGAATASDPLGPYTDLGAPLLHDAQTGLIDATEFEDDLGNPYLVWKVDGNATGQKTPLYGQALTPDGLALQGTVATLITNDLGWEGGVVEGPWVVRRSGRYYLFYSGNSYANATYAVGVARADAPLGPYVKAANPILKSNAVWIGPGHCSVLDGPSGDSEIVYHAWSAGHVAGPGDVRMGLVDAVSWSADWPSISQGPSVRSVPLP